jgi:hypothetical protein
MDSICDHEVRKASGYSSRIFIECACTRCKPKESRKRKRKHQKEKNPEVWKIKYNDHWNFAILFRGQHLHELNYRRDELNISDKFLDAAMQSPGYKISIAPTTRVRCGTNDNDGKFAYCCFDEDSALGIDVKFANRGCYWGNFTPAAFKENARAMMNM